MSAISSSLKEKDMSVFDWSDLCWFPDDDEASTSFRFRGSPFVLSSSGMTAMNRNVDDLTVVVTGFVLGFIWTVLELEFREAKALVCDCDTNALESDASVNIIMAIEDNGEDNGFIICIVLQYI